MKRFKYLLLFLLLPFTVKAAAISGTDISGPSSIKVDDKFNVTFTIYISGIEKGNRNGLGLALAAFELDYDTNVLSALSISANDNVWDSQFHKENGKNYVISNIKENKSSSNLCVDKFSYCSNYSVNIQFSVKDTNVENTTIKMGEVDIGVIPMLNSLGDFNEEDIIEIEGVSNKTKTINIVKNTSSNETSQNNNSSSEVTKKDSKVSDSLENTTTDKKDNTSDVKTNKGKQVVYKNKEKEKKKEFKVNKKYVIIPSIIILLIISIILFINHRTNKKIDKDLNLDE